MDTKKISTHEKKQKLLAQRSSIEKKIEMLDKRRVEKVSSLAKKFLIMDLPDEVLESEFKLIQSKHNLLANNISSLDNEKKSL